MEEKADAMRDAVVKLMAFKLRARSEDNTQIAMGVLKSLAHDIDAAKQDLQNQKRKLILGDLRELEKRVFRPRPKSGAVALPRSQGAVAGPRW